MIVGEHFAFDIRPAHLHGTDWIVLEMVGEGGERIGCRWHVDAAPREIAVALHALADQLDPDPTNI